MSDDLNKKILSDLTVHMKYAKFIPELIEEKHGKS